MLSTKLLFAIAISIVLLVNQSNGASIFGRQLMDPDSEEIPSESPQGGGFIQRIMGIIRGILNGGRAFLTGSTQRIIEYVTSILGNLAGASSGSLRARSQEAERELAKVAKDTERYTMKGN